MARKPNYRFARLERERSKAARKAERAKLKAERAELRRQEKSGQPAEGEATDDGAVDQSDGGSAGASEDDRAGDEDVALP
jgi:hypothetical protein